MSPFRRAIVGACLAAMACSGPVLAAAPDVFDDATKKQEADKKKAAAASPWSAALDLGAGLALSSVSNVVGTQDGLTLTLSASIVGAVDYRDGIHDWRNRLTVQVAYTQSPVLPGVFVKATDIFEFDSAYFLRLIDLVGPFVRFGLAAPMLPGVVQQSDIKSYQLDGTELASGEAFDLTDPFQPLTLKQSLGAFIRPYREKTAEIEFRVGVGAREVIADGQRTLADDEATEDIIELAELRDSVVVGGEIRAQLTGQLESGRIAYAAHAEFLLPFYDSVADDTGLSFADSINYDFGATLSFKIVEWMSLDYALKAVYQPQVVEKWQVTNTLLLNFGWGFRTSTGDKADAK